MKEILPSARPETEIRSWEDLRANIKQELKKKAKTLPLKDRPAYDFATLRIKGYGKIAASVEIARQWHEGERVHFARRVTECWHGIISCMSDCWRSAVVQRR